MKIGVVILNYNTWEETLVCAESVLASDMPPTWLILVDNASTNDSVRWIKYWAKGNIDFVLHELGAPSVSHKPLIFSEIGETEGVSLPEGGVTLLHRKKNEGYAAGNNAGIRILMRHGADAVLILNNDTIVDRHAIGAMQQRLFSKRRPGLCGASILYTENDLIQCRAGGYNNKWSGLSVLNGHYESLSSLEDVRPDDVEKSINFIYGACVMVSHRFLQEVGLMDERYFLYCEEQDWAYRGAKNFDLAYAPDAIVWHKEGASTGFSHIAFNPFRLYELTRSRVILTAKHIPIALPTVFIGIFYAALRMTWRRLIKNLCKHHNKVKAVE